MNNNDKKILFGISIVFLFIISASLSYAYFSSSVTGNENAKDMVVEAGTLKLTYTDSPQIIMQNIKPGQTITKKVTVKNTGTLDTAYNLVWQELYNKIGRNDLVMSYTCERLNSSGTVDGICTGLTETPVKTKTITKNIPIESGVTHNYTITITFKETGENQNYNQGKSFNGVLGIEEYSNIAGTLKNRFYEESGMTDRGVVKSISFYSDNRVIDGAESYDVSEEQNGSVKMYVKQNGENNSLYDLTIVGNGIIAFPEDSSNLFSFYVHVPCRGPLSNLTLTEFNNSIDTRNVTNMSGMFSISAATTLDLSNFDTSNVTSMENMFSISAATNLDLSNFDTSNVTDMSWMFSWTEATTINVSSFNTSNVTSMENMFSNSAATTLDLSSFDTSKVTDMSYMFSGSEATTLDLSNFDTSNVTNMSNMFSSSVATTLDLSSFDTSNVTYMSGMFSGSKATTLDLSNFDTSNVTSMENMFFSSAATTLDLSKFNTSKVTNMSGMFSDSKATTINVSSFNTSNVANMRIMFSNSKATTLDLSSFNTSNVTDMSWMFSNSNNLKTIYASSKYNTSKVASSTNMFNGCTSLVGGAGTTYDSTKVDKTYARIDGGTSNPGYFTSK